MRAKFIARITHLHINGSLGNGVQFMNGFYITNDKKYINGLLSHNTLTTIGTLEYNFILEGPVAYSIFEEITPKEFEQKAQEMLTRLEFFEHHLWLLHDCSIGHEVGFVFNEITTTSVRFGGFHTRADGTTTNIDYNADNFRTVVKSLRAASRINDTSFNKYKAHSPTSDRVWLAMHLIGYARWTVFIPNKIAFYCSALEALLSTSQSELSHQVAERVAVLTTKNDKSRFEAYKFVKKCYDIRSKYIHGNQVKYGSEQDMYNLSKKLDETVRATLHAVFEDEILMNALTKRDGLDELLISRALGIDIADLES